MKLGTNFALIEIPLQMDDMPISPEAFRVYFAIARSVAEYGGFPKVPGGVA